MRVRKISQISISGPGAVGAEGVAARDAGTGGGRQWGQPTPTTLKLWERRPPPPNFGLRKSFTFGFVYASELGSLPKNGGPNPGVLSFG